MKKIRLIYSANTRDIFTGLLIGLLSVTYTPLQAQAQVRKYAIIDKVKRDTYNFLEKTSPNKKQKKDKRLYTVYSDRANNKVFFSAKAHIAGDTQDFLTPYYVIDEKNDYLEVVSHDPSLLGKPKGIFSFLFRGTYSFTDAQQMEYIGWIHKNNVVRYAHPKLSSINYKPLRYVVGIQDPKTLYTIEKHVNKQSVFLYEDPLFVKKSSKRLHLDQLVYLYKYDTDKKAALVSNLDHMKPADSLTRIMGWIPKDLLKKVGQQRVVTLDKADSLALSYQPNTSLAYVTKKDIATTIMYDGAEHQKRPVAPKEATDVVLPLAVWDHSDNKLINLDGDTITLDKIDEINEAHKHINFHYIFDCSKNLKEKHLTLMSSLQKIWVTLSTDEKYSDYKVSFSASSYGCGKLYSFPKTTSFSSWIDYLHGIFSDSGEITTTKTNTRGIQQCFQSAVAAMPQESFATNIILIAGEKNFFMSPSIRYTLDKMGRTSSRLLFYQLENKATAQYQDYILKSKDILSSVSKYHADFIRAYIVDNALMQTENVFANIPAVDNVYVYDAPENSTYQGGVVFPKINTKLRASSLDLAIDSVLSTALKFNSKLYNSLVYNANKLGYLRSKPSKAMEALLVKDHTYRNRLQDIPRSYMQARYYEDKSFTAQDNPSASSAYLLSKQELVNVVEAYKTLFPSFRRIAKRSDRKKIYASYRKMSRGTNKKIFRKTLRKKDRVADLVFMKTGLPVQSEFLQETKMKDIYKKRKTSNLDFTRIMKKFSDKIDGLEKTLSDKEAKMYADGGDTEFYVIPEDRTL